MIKMNHTLFGGRLTLKNTIFTTFLRKNRFRIVDIGFDAQKNKFLTDTSQDFLNWL